MEKLYPIFWLAGVLFMYASICAFSVLTLEGFKYRNIKMLFYNIGAVLPGILFFQYVHAAKPVMFVSFFAITLVFLLAHYIIVLVTVKDWKRAKQRKEYLRKTILHEILVTGSVIFLVPFVWLVTTSVKEESETFKYPPVWIPTQQAKMDVGGKLMGLSTVKIDGKTLNVAETADLEDGRKVVRQIIDGSLTGKEITVESDTLTQVRKFAPKWDNYTEALDFLPKETHKGLLYLWNTVYITIMSIIGTLLSSSLVAYSFARLRWPGRDALFGMLLATMMLPAAVTMIPVFLIFRTLGWYDTLKPLWITSFFAGAFSVFLLRQFFMTIPTELEDAAKIDGCSYFGIYWRIMLPLIKPALAALTIMTFMGTWNNFMGPLIYLNSPEKMTLAYGLQLFQSSHGAEYGLLMAASTLVMLPVLIIFFFTQRYFIQGITLTGMGGK
ncbi:MAG: carbohydrate ABC transporter permease [Armatimonadota bacterium]